MRLCRRLACPSVYILMLDVMIRMFREKGVEIMGPDKLNCGDFLTSDKIPHGYTQDYFECCARGPIQYEIT